MAEYHKVSLINTTNSEHGDSAGRDSLSRGEPKQHITKLGMVMD